MKQCKSCEAYKHLSEFYNHPLSKDKKDSSCKDCKKEANNRNRAKNSEKYKEYDRARANQPKRVAARKAYARTEEGKRKQREGGKAWVRRNPEKRKAHNAVSNAIRDGKLFKKPCKKCGEVKVQAHHEDYNKPLDVIWLCVSCHSAHHVELKTLK